MQRVVLAAGDLDITSTPLREDARALGARGVPTRFVSLGRFGHGYPGDMQERMREPMQWVSGGNEISHGPMRDVTPRTFFGCYLRPDESVWCWGTNGSDVLGGAQGSTSKPVEVHGPSNVGFLSGMLEVSARAQLHACARDTTPSGNVWCWGNDDYGAIGTGGSVGTGATSQPVQVQVANVRQIAIGDDFSCAIIGAQGEVACWGENASGELGHSNLNDQTCTGNQTPCDPDPTLVGAMSDAGPPLSGVVQISLGEEYACALKGDGTVWCWGGGANGRLGNGATHDSATPVQVLGLP